MKNFLQNVAARFVAVIFTLLSILHVVIVVPIFWSISIVCLLFLKEEACDKILKMLRDNLLIWPYRLLGVKDWTDFCNITNSL